MSDSDLHEEVLTLINGHGATPDEIEELGDACHRLAESRRQDNEVFLR